MILNKAVVPLIGALVSACRADDSYVVTDVLVRDMDTGSAPAGYTGLQYQVNTAIYVPGNTGSPVTPQDVNQGIGGLTVGIYVRYELLSTARAQDLSIVTDVSAQSFESKIGSTHGYVVGQCDSGNSIPSGSSWSTSLCPSGYAPATGTVGGVAGALSVQTKGACLRVGLCVRKKQISQISGNELYVQSVGLSKTKNGENQWKPGRDWTVDNLDIHRLCGDDYTFKLVMLRRVLPYLRQTFSTSDQKRKLLTDNAPVIYLHGEEQYFPSSLTYHFSHTTRKYSDGSWNLWSNDPVTSSNPQNSIAWFQGTKDLSLVPIYAFYDQKQDNVVDLIYFAFYPYNRGKEQTVANLIFGNHVGDWEHVTIRLVDGVAARVYLPYHAWGNQYKVASGIVPVSLDSGRVVAFSAKGSHGNWPIECGKLTYKDLVVIALNDNTQKGIRWETWRNMEAFEWNSSNGDASIALPGNREFTSLPQWLRSGNGDAGRTGSSGFDGPINRYGDVVQIGCVAGQCNVESGPTGPRDKGIFGGSADQEF